VDDFRKKVAMFVFNVSNLLFSQVSTLQTDTEKQTSSGNVQNPQRRFGSPLRDPFFPFSTLLWILIHTLGNTGLDQLTYRIW